MHIACEKDNENIVEYLVEKGADIYEADEDGQTPWRIACENDNKNIVKYLIRAYSKVRWGAIFSDSNNED